MNKKNIIISSIVVVVAIGLIWTGRSGSNGTANVNSTVSGTGGEPARMTSLFAEEGSFDFGTISMAAGKVSHTFKMKNDGSQPVTIAKLYTSCMCTNASFVKGSERLGPFGMPGHGFIPKIDAVVAPGEEFTVQVVFDPAAHGPAGIGPVERAVAVETADSGTLELRIAATVRP